MDGLKGTTVYLSTVSMPLYNQLNCELAKQFVTELRLYGIAL